MYIEREMEKHILEQSTRFPVVSLTGPRQSGKTTLARHAFPQYRYASLEDPDTRRFALDDPRGFFMTYPPGSIIDEVQRVPELFNYLQTQVDKTGDAGQYVLSGSQNFLLAEGVTQSLAGRTAVAHLLPLSRAELAGAGLPDTADEWMLMGGFPRMYQFDIAPDQFFPSYIETYLERDARGQLAQGSLVSFQRFLTLCAGRVGQILDIGNLAQESGIDARTARRWLDILVASMVVFLVQPYHNNFNKRLVKRPKLYFCDTGLACALLAIRNVEVLARSPFRGAVFENMVFAERIKRKFARGRRADLWFWHETSTNEVDLVEEDDAGLIHAIEIKSGATFHPKWFDSMKVFSAVAGVEDSCKTVVYGGDEDMVTSKGEVVSWRNW